MYDQIQYFFITNFLSYDYLMDVQLMMRFSIKLDYAYTELITPIEFLSWQGKMEKIEEERKKERDKHK